MKINELIDVITTSSDPAELSHAADKFFSYFIYIQRRCDVDEQAFDTRIDALISLLPNDVKKLKLIAEKMEPIAYPPKSHNKAPNIFCASLCTAAEGKTHMLTPNYRERCSEIVEIAVIAESLIAKHQISHESKLTTELKNQLRTDIAVKCSEQTEQFHNLSENERNYLIDEIMDRIKCNHHTMRTVNRYHDPAESELFKLYQLTSSLSLHLYSELDTLLRNTSYNLGADQLLINADDNKMSLLDETKKLNLSKSQLAKATDIVTKMAATEELHASFKKDSFDDVVNNYRKIFTETKPLLMKNADPITKRLLHWIGVKLNIKRFQNQILNRYTTLEKYVTNQMLLYTQPSAKNTGDETPTPDFKNKK